MRLENWSIIGMPINPYAAPETLTNCVQGNIYDDEKGRFENGKCVTTSSIISKKDNRIVTKSGNEYDLGEVNPEYEKLFPKAKERLLNSLE